MTSLETRNLGYPRIGARRELKRAVEAFWKGESTEDALEKVAAGIRKENWEKQIAAGIEWIPSNDFSFYDQVLDMTCMLGNVPQRFEWDGGEIGLDLMFRMARGRGGNSDETCCGAPPELACEMTKWFDTNYHYLVPEFGEKTTFRVSSNKAVKEYQEAKGLGIETVPVLVGPLTYLALGKEVGAIAGFDRFLLAGDLIEAYTELLAQLEAAGATRVQIDEPAFSLDLTDRQREIARSAYSAFASQVPSVSITVATYFGELRENLETVASLPVEGVHFDAVRGKAEVNAVLSSLTDSQKKLSLGVIDGRNIWKTDLKAALRLVEDAVAKLGPDRVQLAPSCSLIHVPVSLQQEDSLDPEIANWLAFADEKLIELSILRGSLTKAPGSLEALLENESAIHSRKRSQRVNVPSVQARVASLTSEMLDRKSSFIERQLKQRERLALPEFPTTTIGSFPQTDEVRKARARFRKGEWKESEYRTFLRLRTADCIKKQERIGLDVLVHGEFERNDMVEYFGEQLDGFAFTKYGWVQSYGSRCVKPPIIFGDVSRPEPMTVEWAAFAKEQTEKPMKGMLTGPVTILQWSFVRDDQPRKETACQIALAIRDEVLDLEKAGLPIVQIDEAAIREGLPLRRDEWSAYFEWAVNAFRLAASGVRGETQIHTHMCYSEFNDMLEAIVKMDADVITIENARSNLELLQAFAAFDYPNEIGPGVYDIHSPRVPMVSEMVDLLEKASSVLPAANLWVNPDCGLKTRSWADVEPALERMVAAAKALREKQAVLS